MGFYSMKMARSGSEHKIVMPVGVARSGFLFNENGSEWVFIQ